MRTSHACLHAVMAAAQRWHSHVTPRCSLLALDWGAPSAVPSDTANSGCEHCALHLAAGTHTPRCPCNCPAHCCPFAASIPRPSPAICRLKSCKRFHPASIRTWPAPGAQLYTRMHPRPHAWREIPADAWSWASAEALDPTMPFHGLHRRPLCSQMAGRTFEVRAVGRGREGVRPPI